MAVLLLTTMLVVFGMTYLASQAPEAQASMEALDAAEAYQMARSGIDEARLKLSKDNAFPPDGGQEQDCFTYSESLGSAGSYRVSVDFSRVKPPHLLYEIKSMGFFQPKNRPLAQATVTVWLKATDMTVVRWDE